MSTPSYSLDNEPRQYVVTVLAAGICGTDDAVTLWNALGTERGRYPVNTAGSRDYMIQTNPATGSVFTIQLRGVYHVKFTVNCVGAAGPVIVIGGIARAPDAATIAGAVTNASARIVDIAQFSQIEAVTHSLTLSGMVNIDERCMANATNTIQILLTDEAGATPPDADVVQASAFACFTRVSDLMGAFA